MRARSTFYVAVLILIVASLVGLGALAQPAPDAAGKRLGRGLDDVIGGPYSCDFLDNTGGTTFEGSPVPKDAVIDAYDPDGVHCGTIKALGGGQMGPSCTSTPMIRDRGCRRRRGERRHDIPSTSMIAGPKSFQVVRHGSAKAGFSWCCRQTAGRQPHPRPRPRLPTRRRTRPHRRILLHRRSRPRRRTHPRRRTPLHRRIPTPRRSRRRTPTRRRSRRRAPTRRRAATSLAMCATPIATRDWRA